MITVAAALLMMAGCTAPGGGNSPEKPASERRAKAPRAKAMFELDHITADGQSVTIFTKRPEHLSVQDYVELTNRVSAATSLQ